MKTLANLLSNSFNMINSRLNTFCGIIKSMLLTRGINFKHFASEIEGKTQLSSKEQSVSRFLMNKSLITMEEFYQFIVQYFPAEKMILSIDRTNWERGKKKYNVMVIAASFRNIAMPIIFSVFNHKGASNTKQQIKMVNIFIRKFGKDRIKAITGDREFGGRAFIKYLNDHRINFVIRIKSNTNLANTNLEISNKNIRVADAKPNKNLSCNYCGCDVNFTKIKTKAGDDLSLIASRNLTDNPELIYKQRWDIETAFKGCKSNGFQLEQTHIINRTRFINLLKCLFISYAIAINIGWNNLSAFTIKFKKTLGSYERSILQHGLYLLREHYSISKTCFWNLINKTSSAKLVLDKSGSGLEMVLVT